MKALSLHPWRLSPQEMQRIQRELAQRVSRQNELAEVRFIAGADIAAGRAQEEARAAVVVLSYPGLEVVEVQVNQSPLAFPYVPGLLSFRESPLILPAFEKLSTTPDLLFVDGQGIAHPRRLGIASHLGLLLDLPTIGCAKSILVGQHAPVGEEADSWTELVDHGEVIGAALRTRPGVKPVYVSIGHKVDLPTAIQWTLRCCRGFRLPEPTRLADQAAGGKPLPTQRKLGL